MILNFLFFYFFSKLNPSDEAKLKEQQAYCEEQMQNANHNAIGYRLICFKSLRPIQGQPKVSKFQ